MHKALREIFAHAPDALRQKAKTMDPAALAPVWASGMESTQPEPESKILALAEIHPEIQAILNMNHGKTACRALWLAARHYAKETPA